jgi:phosphatidylglycerophosphate synthase
VARARTGLPGWSRLHAGVVPGRLGRSWLSAVQGLAALRPVARIPPDALSAAGVLAAAGALLAASAGGAWALLSAVLVVVSGLLDGLDGAVALHTGRARPLGAVVDAMADRLGDLLLAATLVALGAPAGWCVAAAALVFLHEYLRSRAQAAGMAGAGAVTVAERPTRIVLVAVAACGTGALPAGTPLTGWAWATVCAVGWVAVGAVGLVHLAVRVARSMPARFPGQAGPTSSATIAADSATSGSPPPGCAEPPTR